VLAVALLIALLQLLYWLGARRYFASLADAVAPVAQLRFDRVVAFPPGQVGLDGIRFDVAGRGDPDLRADRLRARSDDIAWWLHWLAGRATDAPQALVIELQGVSASNALLGHVRQRADPVGLLLPFEGVGCHGAAALAAHDYAALGWLDWRVDLRLDLVHDHAARRVDVDLRVERKPAGALRAQLRFADVPDSGLPLVAGLGGARLERVEIVLDEQGALAQRNAHCAMPDDDAGDAFIVTHLEQVHAWLQSRGVVPDEPIWAAYREWVTIGGPIHLVAEPAQGVKLAEYPQFAPEDRLRLLGISARMGAGDPVPVEATAARPAGDAFRVLPLLSDIDPDHAFAPIEIREALPDSAFAEVAEEIPESGRPAEDDSLDSVDPDVGNADEGSAARATSSLPEIAVATPPVRASSAGISTIGFPELAMHLGQRVRIDTVNGNHHRGVVLDATADAVELEIRRYGGGARLPIARDQISRITVVDEQP
jgi:hypothetical protein